MDDKQVVAAGLWRKFNAFWHPFGAKLKIPVWFNHVCGSLGLSHCGGVELPFLAAGGS